MSYSFREASPDDFNAIRALNHRTFSEELGQHEVQPGGLLEDRFEARSRYFLAFENDSLVGMVCAMSGPPFSIESRLDDPSILDHWPEPRIEIRLLAIDPAHRNGIVMAGLLSRLTRGLRAMGARTLLISGVTTREQMYERLGFEELGPPVQSGRAAYVPMAMLLDRMTDVARRGLRRDQRVNS